MGEIGLRYANVTGRPPSLLVRAASVVSRGVREVQRQQIPYARAWHEANRAALTHPGPRWIVLGDSMSQAIGASSYDAGWVNQLHKRLARAGYGFTIVNLSASGARVPDVLEQQIPAWRALPPATRRHGLWPDLVTVLIGSNDLMGAQHRKRLPQRFARLITELPDGAVVATLPQPRAAAEAVNAQLARAQEDGRLTVVDMRRYGPTSWRGRLAADRFHPNDSGYAAIADAFHPFVLRTLTRSRHST